LRKGGPGKRWGRRLGTKSEVFWGLWGEFRKMVHDGKLAGDYHEGGWGQGRGGGGVRGQVGRRRCQPNLSNRKKSGSGPSKEAMKGSRHFKQERGKKGTGGKEHKEKKKESIKTTTDFPRPSEAAGGTRHQEKAFGG